MPLWIAGAVAAVLFSAGITAPEAPTQAPAPANDAKAVVGQTANDELIKLALARMSEDILLSVVARTDKTKYDTSADALVKLKSVGVSDRVIAAILAVDPAPAASAAPAVPPSQSVPAALPMRRPPATSAPGSALRVNEDPNLPTTAEATTNTNLRFSVFVSAPQRDGFFDTTKDIQDSIKDIRDRLSKEKNVILTITDDRKRADVILTVVRRGIGNETYGRRVEFVDYYGGASLQQSPMIASTFWVSTMMQVGAYKKEFTGAQTQDQQGSPLTYGAWGKCANQIVSNISSWTKANAVLMNHYKAASAPQE